MDERQIAENDIFLQKLAKKIESKHRPESLKSEELDRVRHKWYVAKLVHQAAQDLSVDSSSGILGDSTSSQVCKELGEELLSAECNDIVHGAQCSSQTSLLSIPQESAPNTHALNGIHHKLIQKRLHKKLLDISQFYQPSVPGAGANLLNAKALQLHHVVSKDNLTVSTNEQEMKRLQSQKVSVIRTLQQVYRRNLQLLESLLMDESLKSVPQKTSVTARNLTAKTEALAAKVGLVEQELLGDTYTPQLVKELTMVRTKLDRELMRTRDCLNVAEKEYASCLSAGTEFKRIAKEYVDIKNDLDARAWALNELKVAKQHKY